MMLLEVSNTQGKKGFYLNLKKFNIERFGRGKYQVSDKNMDDFLKLAARYDITVTKKEVTPIIEDTILLSRITTLEYHVSELSERIAALESPSGTGPIVIETPQQREISDDEFWNYVQQAYWNVPRHTRQVAVEIPKVRKLLSKYTGLPRDEIDKRLYRLFIQHKIDLQPGGSDDPSEQLVSDTGYNFYWFKLKEEPRKETQLEQIKKAFSHYETIEDRTSEWLTMTQSGIQYELEGYTLKQMKQAAARILKPGDRRIKNKQKMIERILKRMKEYRSRFEYGSEGLTQEVLKQAYERVKQKEPRFSDLIPLNYLKKELPQYDNEQINELLLELEKKRIIDLQVAYDATELKEPEYGINLAGRGLVYFVRFRD